MAPTARVETTTGTLDVDLGRAAGLVIDMQNDFGSKGGMFDRGGVDVAPIRAALAPTARVLAALRRARVPLIYVKMGFRPDLSDLGPPGSPNREVHLRLSVGVDGALVRDRWGTEIVDELKPEPGDLQVWKNRFSALSGTELDTILRSLDARWLIVTGCTTSVCVESTIRDAMFRDYSCLLLADCTAEPLGANFARSNHEASLLLIEALFGSVSSSARLLRALDESGPV